jgi:hypothetical protein
MNCKHEGCNNPPIAPRVNKRDNCMITHKECQSCKHLKGTYKITTPERDALLADQDGKCKLCSNPISFNGKQGASKKTAVVDHCHSNGHIRGILCGTCNTALGGLGDTVESLMRAVAYLKN